MKRTMKKIAAGLIVLLMTVQLVPALGATYSSGMIVGSPEGYKEELEIVASKGTCVLVGQTLELDVNEDYIVVWTSENKGVATVDEHGVVTAVSDGIAVINAESGKQKASVEITVIDPEPILQETPTDEQPQGQPVQGGEAPAEKKVMVIVINGENENIVYDGEEHVLDRFVATSNDEAFDAGKVKASGEFGVKATGCGTYILNLEDTEFTYDDPDVVARFMVNNSYLKITPAPVTVAAEPAAKEAGKADPEFTATVTGLFGEDTVEYTLTREQGEGAGTYMINAAGEERQGNYKVQYTGNVLTITEPEAEEELEVWIESLYPENEPVYYGAKITLEAHVTGAREGEYTIRWQYSKDLENWIDVPNANGLTYTFTADGETVTYAWRAVADRIK